MNYKTSPRSFLALLLIFFGSFNSHSQQTGNISMAELFVQEVYADCPQYQGADQIDVAIDYLQRTVYHVLPESNGATYPLLSSLQRKDKCNPAMSFELSNFNPETFNPLKYFFHYHSTDSSSFFRVDGTDYVIEIKPEQK